MELAGAIGAPKDDRVLTRFIASDLGLWAAAPAASLAGGCDRAHLSCAPRAAKEHERVLSCVALLLQLLQGWHGIFAVIRGYRTAQPDTYGDLFRAEVCLTVCTQVLHRADQ